MQRSQTIGELAKALASAQAEFTPVAKSGYNPHFKSRYAELGDLIGMATPILTKYGLTVIQPPELAPVESLTNDVLTTMVVHSSGEYIEFSMPLYMGQQTTSQAQGSAITYARRYAYGAALGIVTDDDDDGNTASQQTRTPPKARSSAPQFSQPTAVVGAAAKPLSGNGAQGEPATARSRVHETPTQPDQDRENARGLLKNAVTNGYIESGPANEMWSHYAEWGFDGFCDRLEQLVSTRTQTASAPERPKSATVVSLEDRVAQVQANQRVRPAPES